MDQGEVEICQQQSGIVMRQLPVVSFYVYLGGRQIKASWACHIRVLNLRCVQGYGI